MPLSLIRRIFSRVAEYVDIFESDPPVVDFVWHGGEPLLVPLDTYDAIHLSQREILGDRVGENYLQTNLTVLTDRHLEFLRRRDFFTQIGVSFDVFGDQRVDVKGRLRTEQILSNIERLQQNSIPFGAITVLAQNTAPHVERIYHFFDTLGIHSRFLPFYQHAFLDQLDEHGLQYDTLVECLVRLFNSWLSSETATPVSPIDEYIDFAMAYHCLRPMRFFDKDRDEYAFIVNIDGSVFGIDEIYVDAYRYGSVQENSIVEMLNSPGRIASVHHAQTRRERYCVPCPYYGSCSGQFVQEASQQQQDLLLQEGCPVRGVLDHLVPAIETAVPMMATNLPSTRLSSSRPFERLNA